MLNIGLAQLKQKNPYKNQFKPKNPNKNPVILVSLKKTIGF